MMFIDSLPRREGWTLLMILLLVILLRNFPVTTWWCFSNTQNILKEWGRALKKVERPIYYFCLDSVRLRQGCDCYHSYRATASLPVSRSVIYLQTSGYAFGYTKSLLHNISPEFFRKSTKISPRIAQKDACNFFRFLWCCCPG